MPRWPWLSSPGPRGLSHRRLPGQPHHGTPVPGNSQMGFLPPSSGCSEEQGPRLGLGGLTQLAELLDEFAAAGGSAGRPPDPLAQALETPPHSPPLREAAYWLEWGLGGCLCIYLFLLGSSVGRPVLAAHGEALDRISARAQWPGRVCAHKDVHTQGHAAPLPWPWRHHPLESGLSCPGLRDGENGVFTRSEECEAFTGPQRMGEGRQH